MCIWVSACSVGDGKVLYFSKRLRDQIKARKLWDSTHTNLIDDPDSHSEICAYFGVSADQVHKYEFRPLDRKFFVDQIARGVRRDSAQIEAKMRRVNYRLLAPPELNFKRIIHPFKLPLRKPTKQDLSVLKTWDSVWHSVGGSVRDSVWDSRWDSVWAYAGSFFQLPRNSWQYTEKIPGRGYPFQSAVTLWERGLVPSFDGEKWRLHSGPKAEIVWTGKAKK